MNPYQVMGIIAGCTILFAGVVAFITSLGVPLLVAFLLVYLTAVWCMISMQRKANELSESRNEHLARRRLDATSVRHVRRVRVIDPETAEQDQQAINQTHLHA